MLTLNVGISKKVGLPNYSSLGADCHVSIELPGDLLDHPEEMRKRIQLVYAMTAQAVADELARHQVEAHTAPANGHANGQAAHQAEPPATSPKTAATRARRAQQAEPPPAPRAPVPPPPPPPPRPAPAGYSGGGRNQTASEKQIRCLHARCRALGIDVGEFLEAHDINNTETLTMRRCSDLIDQLATAATNN